MRSDERFSFYAALDGPHLDGLIGGAGILRFDWPEKTLHIEHFDGVSAGHNVSVAPNNELALLGNFSQQIVVVDVRNPDAMRMVGRQSTMYFEECAYRLRSNTHHLWYDDSRHFIGAIGDHLYRFDVQHLREPECLGPHRLENAHELRWDGSRRWILMGDLGPERHDVRQIGIFDLHEPDSERRARKIRVQNNVWHVAVHPSRPVGYALTYSYATDDDDHVLWAPAYVREYIYEVDLENARILRTWSSGAEFPIHLNSDVEVSADDVLTVASGGSHSVVEIPLDTFDRARVTRIRAPRLARWWQKPKLWRNVIGGMARRPTSQSQHFFQAFQMTDWNLSDGVYAARVSPGGRYLVVGHRGYNYLAVYDRASMKRVYDKVLPFRRDCPGSDPPVRLGWRGHHLGLHHSEIVARA